MGTESCNIPCCDLWLSSGPIFSTNPAESFMLGRVRKPPNLPSSINFIDVIDGPAVDWSDIMCIYIQYMCVCIYIWRFPKIEVPPKSSILRGFSIINHPCWDIPHLWKPPYIFTEKQLSGVELRLWLWQLGKSMANYCQRRICLSPWLLQLTEGTTRHPLNYHQCLNLVESLPGLHPPYPRSTMVCRP